MLFNSINYFLFLFVVFVFNYLIPNRFRWILLLISSILFYLMAGTVTFVIPVIILISTYFFGILIESTLSLGKKKLYFVSGLFINLGFLIFFKYINFILVTFIDDFNFISNIFTSNQIIKSPSIFLQFAVPLGLSFITFQAIGYLIEIKRGNQISEKSFGLFATYLLFFPKILSGPIERAHNFIPQLKQKHNFDYELVIKGLKRILWGLFLKLVVADRLALYTGAVFNNSGRHTGITFLVASIFFTIQLFADFAGYTDIAIGSANLLGYKLMENFNSPFKSKSIAEFWGRWHISLSSWLRDYVFLPLSYSIARKIMKGPHKIIKADYISYISGAIITMTICGIWHGASWNFVIFGFLQGFIMTIEILTRKKRKKIRKQIPSWFNGILGMSYTFIFFSFSTIFFKANNISDAFSIIKKIFILSGPFYIGEWQQLMFCIFAILVLFFTFLGKEYFIKKHLLIESKFRFVPQLSYLILIIIILLVGVFDGGQFIYFQF